MAIGMQTYDQADKRESLLSILKDTSDLKGNWLLGNLAESSASQPLHQWTTFSVARPTSVTHRIEGADATVVDHTVPAKGQNYTAILSRVVQVTGSDQSVDPANGYDPMAFQKKVALDELGADMEYAILRGSAAVAGSSGVARTFAGVEASITSNFSAQTSGTSFTSTELEDILQMSWEDVGPNYVANTLLVPMVIKRRISGFTTNVTNYSNRTDKLFRNVSLYEASTGVVEVVPHKDMRATAGSVCVLAIRPELFRVAYLSGRKPKWEALAKTGDADKGHYITELTVESLGEVASAKRTGYATGL